MNTELSLFICLFIILVYMTIYINDTPLNCDNCCPYVNEPIYHFEDDFGILLYEDRCRRECACHINKITLH